MLPLSAPACCAACKPHRCHLFRLPLCRAARVVPYELLRSRVACVCVTIARWLRLPACRGSRPAGLLSCSRSPISISFLSFLFRLRRVYVRNFHRDAFDNLRSTLENEVRFVTSVPFTLEILAYRSALCLQSSPSGVRAARAIACPVMLRFLRSISAFFAHFLSVCTDCGLMVVRCCVATDVEDSADAGQVFAAQHQGAQIGVRGRMCVPQSSLFRWVSFASTRGVLVLASLSVPSVVRFVGVRGESTVCWVAPPSCPVSAL